MAKFQDDSWVIWEIRNPYHNHSATIAASYPLFCKLNFISAITLEVKHNIKVNIKPIATMESLRLGHRESFNNNKPIYKTRNIYNIQAKICCKNLSALSPIHALI